MTTPAPSRRRDATRTRRLLLEAARNRFASDGYAATTVRDIADDAGVNVALISRYFTSKEGLFEACLTSAVEDVNRAAGSASSLDEIPGRIVQQLTGMGSDAFPRHLVLLLRSSGDTRAEEIRVGMLRTFSERLAALAGGDELLLPAQIVIAASLGIALLRSNTALEPLGSADHDALIGPVTELVEALLHEPPRA